MLLPFNCILNPKPVEIGGISIPRYNSLTVNEAIALSSLEAGTMETLRKSGVAGQLALAQMLASLFLICRVSPKWSMKECSTLFSVDEILEITALLMAEKEAGQKAEDRIENDQANADENEEIDWANIYWKLQRLHPHDQRFNAENFGKCPIVLIEQALRIAREQEIERLSSEARAIANLGVAFAAAKGMKNPNTRWFNDFEAIAFAEQAKKIINPRVAKTFIELNNRGRIPDWVLDSVDLDTMRASAASLARQES